MAQMAASRRPRFPATQVDHFAFQGGLDLMTPRITLPPGRLIDCQNYEPQAVGGYRRINGFERFDGRTTPTSAGYSVLSAVISGTLAAGNTITGATSAATGKVLLVSGTTLVLGRVTGTFIEGEALQVAGVTQATATSSADVSGAPTSLLDATWRLLAANDRRADVAAVPGSGQIRGVFVLADVVYAFRDNLGATASLLYKSTASGWQAVSLGREMLVQARSGTCTISNAAPGVVTWNAHTLANDQPVAFTTTGALPTGLTAGVTYYVRNRTANTFEVSATAGGSSIPTTSAGSGVHTATLVAATGFSVGNIVTGATSGAAATVTASLLRTGTWASGPAGSLVFAAVAGTFSSGEALQVGGVTIGQANGADAAITRLPGGRVEVVNDTFNGTSTSRKSYGVDSVNCGFEFDGTTYVPIHTGMTVDAPTHVEVHKNKLFYSFASSIQYSTTGNPYAWTALTGAAEIAVGGVVTGLMTQTGNVAGSSLAVFTRSKTSILYGSSSLDFQLVASIYELGYIPGTIQAVSNNTYGLTARGVQALITTLNYGDFSFDAVSFNVQTLVQTKFAQATASVTVRGKNQYRLYFSDGTGLVFGLTGEKLAGITLINYGIPVEVTWNSVWSTMEERTFFGSTDGYVYEENVGTSFDGGVIEAWIRPAFNNLKSPRVNKRYRGAVFEVDCEGYHEASIGYDLGYASPNVAASAVQSAQELVGAGIYWDSVTATWDRFTWDSAVLTEPQISIDGSENNIGFVFYSSSAMYDPITVQGASLLYTPRHVTR